MRCAELIAPEKRACVETFRNFLQLGSSKNCYPRSYKTRTLSLRARAVHSGPARGGWATSLARRRATARAQLSPPLRPKEMSQPSRLHSPRRRSLSTSGRPQTSTRYSCSASSTWARRICSCVSAMACSSRRILRIQSRPLRHILALATTGSVPLSLIMAAYTAQKSKVVKVGDEVIRLTVIDTMGNEKCAACLDALGLIRSPQVPRGQLECVRTTRWRTHRLWI